MRARAFVGTLLLMVLALCANLSLSQTPQGFSYQAVVRDGSGNPIANQTVSIRLTIQNSSITPYFSESKVIQTNAQGVLNHIVGSGTLLSGSFASIPWNGGDIYIKVEIDPTGGSSYSQLGDPVKLQSVPYALYASSTPPIAGTNGQTLYHNGTTWVASSVLINNGTNVGIGTSPTQKLDINGNTRLRGLLYDYNNSTGTTYDLLVNNGTGVQWKSISSSGIASGTGTSGQVALWSGANSLQGISNLTWGTTSLQIVSPTTAGTDDPILEVKNKDGKVVFGVYQGGVRIYVDDSQITKGVRGGFAIGGLTNQSKGQQEYFRITPDSARIYIKENPTAKGVRGGFAIGGLTNQSKTVVNRNLMFVAPDSARFYVKDSITQKGVRGGFAIGGLTNQSKGSLNQFLSLTPKNYLIGHEAGNSITTGQFNSFMGYQAGKNNTRGERNVFLGYKSGLNSDSASYNVLIGNESGLSNYAGGYNVFIGNESGKTNTEGGYNVFIGYQAGYSNSTGEYNVANGYKALHSNTYGFNNVANGNQSLFSNTIGNENTANGFEALYSNTEGDRNVADGYQALYKNTLGNCNVSSGYMALYSNTSGNNNVSVGYGSLFANTTGFNNTALGNNCFTSGASYSNSTAVGANSSINASNKIRLGNSAVTVIEGAVTFSSPSDKRFKYNITEDVKGLDFITRLRPVVYCFDTYKYDAFMMKELPDSVKRLILDDSKGYTESSSIRQSGFIAQEVEKAAYESSYDFNGIIKPKTDKELYSLSYSLLTVPLVKAVQELNNKNIELQKQIEILTQKCDSISVIKSENVLLKQRLEKIEMIIEGLNK